MTRPRSAASRSVSQRLAALRDSAVRLHRDSEWGATALATALLGVLVLLAGCATLPEQPPSERACSIAQDALGIPGRVACEAAKPVMPTDLIDSTYETVRQRSLDRAENRRNRQKDAAAFEFCTANPCQPGCPLLVVEATGIVPQCSPPGSADSPLETPSQGAQPGASSTKSSQPPFPHESWSDWNKSQEGFEPRLTDTMHIGHGHNCVQNDDCGHWRNRGITRAEAAELHEDDWAKALDRAQRNLGMSDGAVVSACFRHGCNAFGSVEELLAKLDSGDLRDRTTAAAVRSLL